MRPNRHIGEASLGFLTALLIGLLPAAALGEPVLTVGPSAVTFDTIAVGDTVTASVLLNNSGDQTATVTGVAPVSGNPQLTASPDAFTLGPGQSQTLTFRFAPTFAGDVADAFKVTSNAAVQGSTAPSLNIPVRGTAASPRITVSETRLSFSSTGVGAPSRDTVVVGNAGTDTLNVESVSAGSSAFAVSVSAFELAPGDTQTVRVTYTPTSTPAVSDSLTILSDSPNAGAVRIGLAAAETPAQPKSARISLLRTDGTGSPAAGDSIRIALFLIPGADTIKGVEAFVGFDNTHLAPTRQDSPFTRSTLTRQVAWQINRVTGAGTKDAAAHLSAVFNQSRRAADTLAVLRLRVLQEIREDLTLRVLTEKPLRNSKFLTPENLSFAIPGSTQVRLGNRPPEIRPFEILAGNEDAVLTIDLTDRATDRETAPLDLSWRFEDPSGLFDVAVTTSDTAKTARLTPPPDGFGVFDLLAIVSDAGGAADTATVIVDVRETNDPPFPPDYVSPADSSQGVTVPVLLSWSGGDPEGDALTYEVRTGTSPAGLQPVATGVEETSYEVPGLGPGTTYFWQIVSVDGDGARTEGAVAQFTTAPDETPPEFQAPPRDTLVTANAALIVWTTNETATGIVRIGLSPTLADSSDFETFGSDVFQVLRHEVSLTALSPSTTYYYQARSRDPAGNLTTSEIDSFRTLPPAFNPGDFDGNLTIDFSDFLAFAAAFNTAAGEAAFDDRGDFDGNGQIDFADFLAFVEVFNTVIT